MYLDLVDACRRNLGLHFDDYESSIGISSQKVKDKVSKFSQKTEEDIEALGVTIEGSTKSHEVKAEKKLGGNKASPIGSGVTDESKLTYYDSTGFGNQFHEEVNEAVADEML